jgi:AcrR family transcriptional regulator
VPLPGDAPALGLRERKKARTRAAIQRHALQLFREHGYEATTVSQIAEAAEVSESTFFRYFPTKEDVVLWDELDPVFIAALRAQPVQSSPIRDLRTAIGNVLGRLPPEEQMEQRQRLALMLSIPPLRAASADQLGGPTRLLTEAVAERAGRSPDDLAVRILVGAVVGACLAAVLAAIDDPGADIASLIDQALAQLEAGLPL